MTMPREAFHRLANPAPALDCRCVACERLRCAIAFHQAALVIGYPALILATRSIARLIATEVDRRHRLGSGIAEYLSDASDGLLLDIRDPITAGIELAGRPPPWA